MDTEKIYSALADKIGQTSLSKKTITDYINATMPKEGEPDDAWFTSATSVLKSLSGNLSHDVAQHVNDFKKNYNPEPKADPSPAPTPEPAPSQENEQMKMILEQMKAMQEQMASMQTKGLEDNIRNSAIGEGARMNANAGLWEMAVKQTPIESGMNGESFLERVKPVYENMQKSVFGNSMAPYGSNDSVSEQQAQAEMDKFFESKGGVWAKK